MRPGQTRSTLPAPADVQKFPLRMKDNDLLVSELYRDPAEDGVTALSVYLTPKTSKLFPDCPCLQQPPRSAAVSPLLVSCDPLRLTGRGDRLA